MSISINWSGEIPSLLPLQSVPLGALFMKCPVGASRVLPRFTLHGHAVLFVMIVSSVCVSLSKAGDSTLDVTILLLSDRIYDVLAAFSRK